MKPDWLGINKRGLGIVRVSSARQDGNVSHETQEAEIRKYCALHRLELTDIIRLVESAAHGKDRKQYAAAMKRAETQGCRHVLFYVYDRETRNFTDAERNERLVRDDRLVLHYVRESKVLHKGSPDTDFFMRDIQAATNKQFIRALQTKVIDSMEQKAQSGWYPSNSAPLGYIVRRPVDEDGKELRKLPSIIVRDPREKNVRWVKREFELRARGLTLDQIRDKCVAEGLVPPEKLKTYTRAAIEYRIKNPFYRGQFIWRGKEYAGRHELIIPPRTAALALSVGRRSFQEPRELYGGGIFGGGWIRCADCGSTIVYCPAVKILKTTGKRRVWKYYRCANGKRAHASLSGLHVQEHELWPQFDQAVDSITLPAALADSVSRALNRRLAEIAREQGKVTEDAKTRATRLQTREDRLYDDLSAGVIDRETYERQLNRFRVERAQLERDAAMGSKSALISQNAESVLKLCKSAKRLYKGRSDAEKRVFLEKLCLNPTLKSKTIRYDLRKPFSVIATIRETGEWWTRLDDLRTGLESDQPPFPKESGRWPT
jgi:site-specific DNA recombinase